VSLQNIDREVGRHPDRELQSAVGAQIMYTTSGQELAEADLPLAGYCQYCGITGAHVELFRPESAPWEGGRITFRARAYYVCGRDHFDAAVREEARAEIYEQFEAHTGVSAAESRIEWKVTDRYCWLCGTHGAIFKSTTRCSKCGEIQRLYIRDAEAGA
jgi:hypothetical protein